MLPGLVSSWYSLALAALAGAAVAAVLFLLLHRRRREELARWRRIAEHAPVALIRADGLDRVTGWNTAATRTFGYPSEEMLGSSTESLDAVGGDGLRWAFARAREEGRWAGTLVARRRDGGRVLCEGVLLDLPGVGGLGREQVGMLLDRSSLQVERAARRRLEEQLRRSQKMEAVGQLTGGVAHDFNNLLTSILGYAELLRRHFEAGSEEQQDLGELERAARRAADLTRHMLAFSRDATPRSRPIEVVGVVDELVKLLEPTLGEGIRLEVQHEAGPSWVSPDRSEVEQVLMNLALNGRDAMPEGGTLTITTGVVRPELVERVEGGVLPPGEYVELQVRDDGKGMSEETRTRIFEPFFTTKDLGKGTGLGLSTVHAIVERSGGAIEVESAPGRGSRFRVLLPRVAPGGVMEPREVDDGAAVDTGTVLVAEDEPLVRRLVCSGLREAGYVVLEAAGAEEALRVAAAHPGSIELLVTDVVMPGRGGVELALRLREDRPGLHVLYISGYAEDRLLSQGARVEGDSFLQKPFTPATLQARIQELLRTPAPGGAVS